MLFRSLACKDRCGSGSKKSGAMSTANEEIADFRVPTAKFKNNKNKERDTMKIVVCIKQVPDTKGGVKFNPDGTLDRGAMLTIMNPDDKAGLEAALRLKDQYGAEVTVVTMGLPKADEVLREAMAMGADKGILVTDRVLGGADTWATSQTLAGAIRNLEYDLIDRKSVV